MHIKKLAIEDVVLITPDVYRDNRGYFLETHRTSKLIECKGLDEFVQGNVSLSQRWVLRGLHYQIKNPQGKLVSCLRGSIFDVAVDLRQSSPTFGGYAGVYLDDITLKSLWVPPGFAHGFLSLTDDTLVSYQCSSYYTEENARSIRWDDPALGIRWPIGKRPSASGSCLMDVILSDRDRKAPFLRDAELFA
jgi:dTDP-4-dehydrorhamnose 3,5-epimerase